MVLGVSLLLASSGCRRASDAGATAEPEQREAPAPAPAAKVDEKLEKIFHDIGVGYFEYPKVDDRPHFAPGPCAPPQAFEDEPRVRLSSADASSLHTKKLYYLWVKDHESYLHPKEGQKAPVGQVLVKQAFAAVEVKDNDKRKRRDVASRDGHDYITGDPLALFIMAKFDEKQPNTDEGWLYAVVDFDGTVRQAGVLNSCAKCHANAQHDRIFGPIGGN